MGSEHWWIDWLSYCDQISTSSAVGPTCRKIGGAMWSETHLRRLNAFGDALEIVESGSGVS
jgi:hypothetical protein